MSVAPLIKIADLTHRYGERVALDGLTLSIAAGELFAILGPNGGGKSTLFRLLSTLLRPQRGSITIAGLDPVVSPGAVRELLGVVFQAPSLDKKLSVVENLWCQGRLYGLSSGELRGRTTELLERFGLADRARERVETLSGGLKRRVELAKGLLHRPRLLLLDEPSAGLDPLARNELRQYLLEIRARDGMTIVLTTHLLDEADQADRIAILDRGKLVALDSPAALRQTLAGESLSLQTADPTAVAAELAAQFALPTRVVGDSVRVEVPQAHEWVSRIVDALPGRIDSLTLGRPSLEDVFIARTGRRFTSADEEPVTMRKKGRYARA